MENKNLYNSLSYGNIIEIVVNKDDISHLNDRLFFIDYIDNTKIKVISNKFDTHVFELNDDGGLDGIDEIIIVHQPTGGYAIINELLPGKIVSIQFSHEDAFIEGEIINLDEDMITVKTQDNVKMYIDFEYSGLLPKYNIRDIKVIPNYKTYHADNFENVRDGTNDYELYETPSTVYSFEQQVNDYIEKLQLKSNSEKIKREILKYTVLLKEYTDLNENQKIKPLPTNQILYSFFNLNPNCMHLVSYYLHKDLYYDSMKEWEYDFDSLDTDMTKWKYSVRAKPDEDVNYAHEVLEPHITKMNTKIEDFHRKIKLNHDINVAIVNKINHPVSNKMFSLSVKDGKVVELPYDLVRIDKDEKIITNGIAFASKEIMMKNMNTRKSSRLLTKVLHDMNFELGKTREMRILNKKKLDDKDIFHSSKFSYYPFKRDESFKEYIENINIGLRQIYESVYDRKEVTMYNSLNKLSLFDIEKLNTNDYFFLKKILSENANILKRKINEKRSFFARKGGVTKFTNIPSNKIYDIVITKYATRTNTKQKPTTSTNFHMSELLDMTLLDNMDLLLFELKRGNNMLNIDFEDAEINKYISDLTAQVNGNVSNENRDLVTYHKIYETKSELLNDNNKLILKNVNMVNQETEKYDSVQFLHNELMTHTKFTGSIKDFVLELDKMLISLYKNEKDIIDEPIFENESDRENIIMHLTQQISELRIRTHDKCFVKNEKTYYTYDGSKWISAADFDTSLSKKKMIQVKNSVDEFEQIKTKIVNDYVISLIHKNEQDLDKRDIEMSGKMNVLLEKLVLIKNNKFREAIKYNEQKNNYGKLFMDSDYDSTRNHSPFTFILHRILAVSDLQRKYTLIQKFISLFTTDDGNDKWYYCVNTSTKLVPKYLYKLSKAYLLYDDHDNVMKGICHNEGYLSENGDAWVHKESGFVIKTIDFDINYGYDESGFKIKMDAVQDIDIIVHDKKMVSDLKPQNKQRKKLLVIIKNATLEIMNDLYIKFKPIEDTESLYENILNIFLMSLDDPKIKPLGISAAVYTILSFLLIYVQTNNIVIEKAYAKCNLSFSGFPYEQDETSIDGINYLSCYVNEKIHSKKTNKRSKTPVVKTTLFKHFANLKKSKDDINVELLYCLKTFLLRNDFIQDIIHRKNKREEDKIKHTSQPPNKFKPTLIELQTINIDDEFKHSLKGMNAKYDANHRKLEIINLKVEEIIKRHVKNETPLLKTHFEEPFLINFCCNTKDILLNYVMKTTQAKHELKSLLQVSDDLHEITTHESEKYYKGTLLNIPITSSFTENIGDTKIYDKETVYLFLIQILNLDKKNKNIPEHLLSVTNENNILNPPDEYYETLYEQDARSLSQKIKLLQEYGFEFDDNIMKSIMEIHHSKNMQHELSKQSNQKKLMTQLSDVFTNFQSEFLTNTSSTQVNKFNEYSENMNEKYNAFLDNHLNANAQKSAKNKMKKVLSRWWKGIYLEKTNNEQFELNIKQLHNINYSLITLVPGLLLNNRKHNNIISDQWGFADSHVDEILRQRESYINYFNKIPSEQEDAVEVLSRIHEYIDLLNIKIFNKNRVEQYSFLTFIFYKLIEIYTTLCENNSILTNTNYAIIQFILNYVDNTSFSYINMMTTRDQSKQSEKSIKTEFLRKMKPQEREAETEKMAHKLGDWSYGNQKRVFKYYKQFYDQDTQKANEIKEVAKELYHQNITNGDLDVYGEDIIGKTTDDMIIEEEQKNITRIANEDGIVYKDDGDEYEDYE